MKKKYIVKDFISQRHYCGKSIGWEEKNYFVEYFDSIEKAEDFISGQEGRFQIETVYMV